MHGIGGCASRVATLVVAGILAGCGGGGAPNKPPVAQSAEAQGQEDEVLVGTLAGVDPEGRPLRFLVTLPPGHGSLALDPATGAFSYAPAADFHGTDSAAFKVTDGHRDSMPAAIRFVVRPVNDAPTMDPPPISYNSAESLETTIPLGLVDVDGDELQLAANPSDSTVARLTVDPAGRSLKLVPLRRGEIEIEVTASDGEYSVARTLRFAVTDATKRRQWDLATPWANAISIANTSNAPVEFDWTHAGHVVLRNRSEILERTTSVGGAFATKSHEYKIWRYVTDNVYHWYPVTEAFWIHDPLVLINSIGFGFCDDVANAFAVVGREAGYDTRVWWLSGHVVPEVNAGGRWKMLDPDLAVFYPDESGEAAGVEAIAANPRLVTDPFGGVLGSDTAGNAYAQELADIYSSVADNRVEDYHLEGSSILEGEFVLPAGAALSYPGKWAPAPVGVDGGQRHEAPAFAQLKLDLPAGFSGPVRLPFVLWATTGSGQVTIDGETYALGSRELDARLQAWTGLAESIEVTAVEPSSLTFLMNPIRYGMDPITTLELRSVDAWALDVQLIDLPEEQQTPH